ncbi:anti-sigma factor family protein [Paenibacillus guangzhouensis]|uniref:anti-sigma factor family protein n=1 Tax=Paenibacillus guangzhouensis TaxID=1473112 RepID=UPI001266A7B0|nr:zf-HC2 domain-containing protein [Paenibacillus guangzhouensis]
MKCEEVQELLGEYWDLPEDDAVRLHVDRHLEHCVDCTQQFRIWEESQTLIQEFTAPVDAMYGADMDLSRNVMARIYTESAWLMPVTSRSYSFSMKIRRNATACIAGFMAIFLCSFLYLMIAGGPSDTDQLNQINALVGGDANISIDLNLSQIAVAYAGDPPILEVVPTYPHYWIALSLLGITFSLLLLNWLARVRR